jgi:hypothetical protein
MALVIIPTACDSHDVYSLWDGDTFLGLTCGTCDGTFPATCGNELCDGNRDDPSYVYCDLTPAHAGPHHYRKD